MQYLKDKKAENIHSTNTGSHYAHPAFTGALGRQTLVLLPTEPPPQSLIPVVATVSWRPEDLLSMVSIVSRWPADLMSLNFTGSLRKRVGFQGVTSRSPGTHRLPMLGRKSTSGLANEACGFTQTTEMSCRPPCPEGC